MASVDIKIDDDYINNMAKKYASWSEELQEDVDSYLKIMDDILADSIIEGETAEALAEFLEYATSLNKIINSLGEECKAFCVNYLGEIDDADSYLY